MAITLEELEIRFSAQFGGLQGQLDQVKNQMTGFSKSTTTASRSLAGLGRVVKTVLFAYAGRALINVGKDALSMANEVVESENLFTESMKGMSQAARDWSDGLQKDLGLNAYTLRKNVGTFNVMFKSMGMGEQKAYDMATGMTQLAEDMASFYNLPSDEAFAKLRAGITGETEPLKRLGIMVDENTIKQYAMAAGISNTGKEMSQQEKLMARYEAIMAQTATAQGDIARTIDSPANQIRILNNQLDMLKISLGQAFQPIQSAVLPLLNSLATALLPVTQAVGYFIRMMTGFSAATGISASASSKSAETQAELSGSLDQTAKSLKSAGGAAKQAAKDSKVGLKAFDEINKLADEATKTGGGGKIEPVTVPDTGPIEEYGGTLDVISQKVKDLAQAMKDFWDKISKSLLGKTIGAAWEALKNLWNNVIKPMGEWMIANPDVVSDALMAIGAAVATWQIGTQSGWLGGIASGLGKIGAAIKAHPGLFAVSLVAAGITLIAGAINDANEKAKRTDLVDRFGEISIGLADLKKIAEDTKTPFVNAMDQLKKEYEAIEASADRIEALAMKSSSLVFSYSLSPEPMSEDQKEELIKGGREFAEEAKKVLSESKALSIGSIPMLFGESVEGQRLIEIESGAWATIEGELATLGGEFNKAIAEFTLNPEKTPELAAAVVEKQQAIARLIREATDISKVEAEVRLHNVLVDFEGKPVLNAETVLNFAKVLNEELDQQTKDINLGIDREMAFDIKHVRLAGELEGTAVEVIDAQVKEIKKIWDGKRDIELQNAQLSVGDVYFKGVASQITAAYSKEIGFAEKLTKAKSTNYVEQAAKNLFGKDWEKQIKAAANNSDISKQIGLEAGRLYSDGILAISVPTAAAQKNAQDLLKAMEPTTSQWRELYYNMRSNGEEVPAWLIQGLQDIEKLESIADASNLWGDALRGGVDKHLDGNWLRIKGAGLVSDFISGLSSGYAEAKKAGKAMADGFKEGIQENTSGASAAGEKLVDTVSASAKKKGKIQSPSRLMAGIGKMMGLGYEVGLLGSIPGIEKASDALAGVTIDAMGGINGDLLTPLGISADGHITVDDDSGIASAIENGIERGVARVMDRLNINLSVDGETFGRVSARTINEAQRNAGRFLLEM